MNRPINILKAIINNPKNISRVFNSEEYYKTFISKKWKGFNEGLPVVDILDLFPEFEETVDPFSFVKGGSIRPIDLALLKALARRYDACKYLEIGTLCGESAANVATIADECVTIDLPPAEMREKMKRSDKFFEEGPGFFSKNLKNVKHILHSSQTFDFSTLGGKFDLIFIDGDHSYRSVKKDTENAFKILRNSSSVIVWHDYRHNSGNILWEVFAGILEGCPKEKIQNLYCVSDTICAVYIEGNFKKKDGIYPSEIPDKSFSIKISAHSL